MAAKKQKQKQASKYRKEKSGFEKDKVSFQKKEDEIVQSGIGQSEQAFGKSETSKKPGKRKGRHQQNRVGRKQKKRKMAKHFLIQGSRQHRRILRRMTFLSLTGKVVQRRTENTASVIPTTSPIKRRVTRKAESTGNIRAENAHAMRTVLPGKRIRKLKMTADLMSSRRRKPPLHKVRSQRRELLRAARN